VTASEAAGRIHVVAASDSGYLPWCATLIRSCLDRHPRRPLTVHVLHEGDISSADEDRLRRMPGPSSPAEVTVRRVSPVLAGTLPTQGGRTIWLRLAAPELLADLGRALYLDSDTLVLAPLDELWRCDVGDSGLGAVGNVIEPVERPRVESLGLDPLRFFNSGVLLLDLDRLRATEAFTEVVRYAMSNADRLLWPDQDALNHVFRDSWQPLHPRWNAQNSLWTWRVWADEVFGAQAVAEATADPGVLHFEGPHLCKPWHQLNSHPWRDFYRATLDRTPWATAPVVDRTVATRVLRWLPPRRRVDTYIRLLRWRARRSARRHSTSVR
jgi:UDP-glucose/galactose:(glucosyl)LPS alpha-1,2-glucosyl/galactosyltransferase